MKELTDMKQSVFFALTSKIYKKPDELEQYV